jgi:hypothetical protein
MTRAGAWAALACLVCCRPPVARTEPQAPVSCSYHVQLDASGLARVQVGCVSESAVTFHPAQKQLLPSVSGASATGGRFAAPGGRLSYAVDLAQLANVANGDFDRAVRSGASFLAPMSSVLLVPRPLGTETRVEVELALAPGLQASVGLARAAEPSTYRLMAHEIPVATYFAFGKLEQRRIELRQGELELTVLDGALDRSAEELTTWVEASARAVAAFYGRFPVPRASVMVLPRAQRDGVVFGKVLPESEPAIALVVGERAPRKALYSDWILVHELFHLGFPSFFEEGKWLDEGLATYYEPIIRVRAGLYTEVELWSELERSMQQGLQAFTELGLENADDFRGIYWGGAIACLVADVEARKQHLERGLEVGLRALRDAGGTASEVWSLSEALAVIDGPFDAPHLTRVAEAHAKSGSAFDLAALFRQLGVERQASGALTLSNSAPLSAVRRAIVHGS